MKTREAWLQAAIVRIGPELKARVGKELPGVRASCGWPGRGRFGALQTMGGCWFPSRPWGAREIFIAPTLDQPIEVLGVLVHELVHVVDGPGHGSQFRKDARKMGLVGPGPMSAPGQQLRERLRRIARDLGPYPHVALDVERVVGPGSRMRRVRCGECGCILRMTAVWLAKGAPTCACGTRMQEDPTPGERLRRIETKLAAVRAQREATGEPPAFGWVGPGPRHSSREYGKGKG